MSVIPSQIKNDYNNKLKTSREKIRGRYEMLARMKCAMKKIVYTYML